MRIRNFETLIERKWKCYPFDIERWIRLKKNGYCFFYFHKVQAEFFILRGWNTTGYWFFFLLKCFPSALILRYWINIKASHRDGSSKPPPHSVWLGQVINLLATGLPTLCCPVPNLWCRDLHKKKSLVFCIRNDERRIEGKPYQALKASFLVPY